MKKNWKQLFIISVIILFLVGCSAENTDPSSNEELESGKIQVVTSIFPMYEIVKEVAGDRADVSLMVGANEDAHHYEPSAQIITQVNEADVFIYSSDIMEFWVESLLAVVENDNLQVIEFGQDVHFEIEDEHDYHDYDEEDHSNEGHDHGGLDPHIWLDLVAVNEQLPVVVDALSEMDPEGASEYASNAEQFSLDLLTLNEEYIAAFSEAENRTFVVQHQAFGHLAHAYDLEQVAIGGLTTEVEVSPRSMAEIVDFVMGQNVPVIYYQSNQNSGVAETIAQETNTEVAILYDLENFPAGLEAEGNLYLVAMKHNLNQLKKSIH